VSRVLGWLLAAAIVVALVLWSQRKSIADNVIASELARRGIPATYEVARIGGRRQVLRNIVVGDPMRPDLTVEQAEVRIRYTLGWPTIGRVTLVRPRLHGTYRKGKLSFGSLDPLIFRDTGRKFELPRLDLRLVDARALIDSDYGRVGLRAEGQGRLDDSFRGRVAVTAPQLAGYGCTALRVSYDGAVAVSERQPRLTGPVRLGQLSCPDRSLSLANAAAGISLRLDREITGAEGTATLATGALVSGGTRAAGLRGRGRFVYRDGGLTARLEAGGRGIATPALVLADLSTEGTMRAHDGFSRIEYQGSFAGIGLRPGPGLDRTLAKGEQAASETLLSPLLSQARAGFAREAGASRFTGELDVRRSPGRYAVVVPRARWRGGSGSLLLELSRMQINGGDGQIPRLAGNFVSGGAGLPRIAGRMERSAQGRSVLRLTMAEYRAGDASLALPQLTLAQGADGSLGFVGAARASGLLPNGAAENLVVPIEGALSARGELALFRRCTTLRFDRLAYASLVLEQQALSLCPPPGGAIIRSGAAGLRVSFGTPSLDVAGSLGQSPIRIRSGPVGFAYPGVMTAEAVGVALGPAARANEFAIAHLRAKVEPVIEGTFDGAEVRLFATPLDVTQAQGHWRFAHGKLALSDTTMRVSDRARPPRFEPLVARGATLTLVNNRIDADALLREPASDRVVARAAIRHDVRAGQGRADLFVDNLRFDQQVQPATLSRLALGAIANARGTISGTGRIDWGRRGVTSVGTFSTDGLDFAAAFGPVRGLAGTIRFTDLLNLVSAPDQEMRVASINPGIEVSEGVVRFELLPGRVFRLKGASWPFLGGTLSLAATDLRLGVAEARRYTLIVEGLDAARFVERMELKSIEATGIFDGRLPLVFPAGAGGEQVGAAVGTLVGIGTPQGVDAAAAAPGSGRIEGGMLQSRPPGGNVSYVAEFANLSTIANFAFQTLRSLDYRSMTMYFNGALEGEIVTNVRLEGVRQGALAKRNFLTKAIANLPIRFILNIRAPFFQLINSFKALSDPAFIKDPRILGLVDERGQPIRNAPPVTNPPATPSRPVQPSESETMR
jgi:hypothetical protein